MKQNLFLFAFSSFSFLSAYGQSVIGTVVDENGNYLLGASVINYRTDQRLNVDIKGSFYIEAQRHDVLRVLKEGFEVYDLKVGDVDFHRPLVIKLVRLPIEIEEVKLAFQPSGDLKKDMKFFKPSRNTEKLNENIKFSLKYKPKEIKPSNDIPSSFKPYDFSAGQVPLLSVGSGGGGVIGLLAKTILGDKSKKLKISTADRQFFYTKIKNEVQPDYFYQHGLDEYDFSIFIVYADKQLKLTERFINQFNPKLIEEELKYALPEFLATHKTHG